MRYWNLCLVLFLCLVAACGDDDSSRKASPKREKAYLKPRGTLAAVPVKGIQILKIDPEPDNKGVIKLGAGQPLLITLKDPPSLEWSEAWLDTATIRGGGQHVEILIDDNDKLTQTDRKFPLTVQGLTDGPHMIKLGLCGWTNECVKDLKQMCALHVNINTPSQENYLKLPSVGFSMPGPVHFADNVPLDFVLHNVPVKAGKTLDGYGVQVIITGTAGVVIDTLLTTWCLYDIVGLTTDSYVAKMQLQKKQADGKYIPVETRFATATRTFAVRVEEVPGSDGK